ncbi:MAG: DUF948 domain-containing protein [Erysipelotrichaceae bacterium]|nr:DUF948 domain-containing protein [Erysipelotrichaceae bacterium]
MSYLQICLCFLVLAGAFALVSLGILLMRSSTAIKEVGEITEDLKVTVSKANVTLDDVNYKLDQLNAPVEAVNGFFVRRQEKTGILGTIINIKDMIFGVHSND